MGAYNCAGTLRQAIESIISQTYNDWELIICDDMSTDDTRTIAEAYSRADSRIVVIHNDKNLGLNHSLNNCLKIARGNLYARMDGDDISAPERLAKLVARLDANPDVALVSSWMSCFDEKGAWGLVKTKPAPAREDFAYGTPFCHAPCMIRTSVLKSLGGYGTEPWLKRSQDYHLWFRLYAAGHKGVNIQEALYYVRDSREATLRRNIRNRLIEARIMYMGFKMLKLPARYYFRIFRPILLGIIPIWLYEFLRRRRRSS